MDSRKLHKLDDMVMDEYRKLMKEDKEGNGIGGRKMDRSEVERGIDRQGGIDKKGGKELSFSVHEKKERG